MIFLPIVQRELRVAARRRSTLRARWWTALLAMLVSFVSLAFVGRGSGRLLFQIFTGYEFGLCLLAGVLLTADALAEEKREGTIGFLFLTDLKGYDVVLGKFVASSLTAFYCLLALLPITALPLLAGGVTGSDYWRVSLALLNALFVSLAVGLCVSAFMRDSHRALGNALGLLLLLVGALPFLVDLMPHQIPGDIGPLLASLSPLSAFTLASDVVTAPQAHLYWRSLGVSNLLGWSFLALASLALPRCWQERRKDSGEVHSFWLGRGRGGVARRRRLREKLLPQHPVAWLVAGDLGVPYAAWAIVAGWAMLVVAVEIWSGDGAEPVFMSGIPMSIFGFGLELLFALQACRFFAEGRRNGALELLLCTPLTSRDILNGQVRALWRVFFWPVLMFVAFSFTPLAVLLTRALATHESGLLNQAAGAFLLGGFNSLRLVIALTAVCWFGMGLALTMKRPSLAPALTIVSVLVLPSVLCWLDIVPDLILLVVGLSRCQRDLRQVLTGQYLSDR